MARIKALLERLERGLLAFLTPRLRRASLKTLYRVGAFIGFFMWLVLPRRRRATIDRIQRHLPEIAPDRKAAAALARASMLDSGRSFAEIFHIRSFGVDKLGMSVRVTNIDLIPRFLANHRPVVVATAHFGSWELLAGILGGVVTDSRPRAVVMRMIENPPLRELMTRERAARGIQVLDKKNAATMVRCYLEQDGIVGFLADQNSTKYEAVFLPFLGETAAVNKGPALLAVQTKALVWPVFLARTPKDGWTHTLHIYDPIDPLKLTGSVDDQVLEICSYYTRIIEDMVRAYPTQWFWMHNRWKTRPESEA